jgi:hypothetical protein
VADTTFPEVKFETPLEQGDVTAAATAVEAKRSDMIMAPIGSIHPLANFNVRVHDAAYEEHVEDIKKSIMKNGFFRHSPLKVFVNREGDQNLFMLVGGYTRFEAAKRAVAEGYSIERLPVVAARKGTTMIDLMIGLDKDNDGKPLSPYERSVVIKRLGDLGVDEDEIAERMNITKQWLGDLLVLQGAPREIHNMVQIGETSARLAIDLIKQHGAKKAIEMLKASGATGAAPNGSGTAPARRVTPRNLNTGEGGETSETKKKFVPKLKEYKGLIEYLFVLKASSGDAGAMDFLHRVHEGEKDALKEWAKAVKPAKKGKAKAKETPVEKPKNPKDVRIKITDDMTDEKKAEARAHNKEVKARKERREARAAAKLAKEAATAAAAAGKGADDNTPL